jgi:nucleoid DNA-binding protein
MKINSLLEKILDSLVKTGKFNLYGIGTFYVKPARKGEFNTKHGRGTTDFNYRITFRCSYMFKKTLNKLLNEKQR